MYFLIGLLIFNMLVFGINFCFLIIGGTPFKTKGESLEQDDELIHAGNKTYTAQRFSVGVSILVLGFSWFVAWLYFLITGWESFLANMSSLMPHVLLHLISSALLVIAGIAVFKKWKRNKGIMLFSVGVLLFNIIISITIYGPEGHGNALFMYLFAMWTFIVGGVFTTGTYFLDRLVHEAEKKKL